MHLGTSLPEKIFGLTQRILGCDDETACEYLECRSSYDVKFCLSEDHKDMLQSEHADDTFSKDDAKLAEKLCSEMDEAHEEMEELTDFISKTLSKKKSKKFEGSKTKIPEFDKEWTTENFIKFLPPGSKALYDSFNGRWKAWFRFGKGPWLSASRSWGNRSHRECWMLILEVAWSKSAAHGQPCPMAGLRTELENRANSCRA